jgi:GDP-L-fucose synthase
MKKIIILGSNGFFGKAIFDKLKKISKYKVFQASKSINLDLTNYKKVEIFFKKIKPDIVVNSAGHGGSVHYVYRHPTEILDQNINMYINIYKASKILKKKPSYINCLCNCVYSGYQKTQNEKYWDSYKVHNSVYTTGNIHRLRYIISRAWNEQFGIKSINLIYGGLFGPGDHLDDDRLHALDGIILRMVKAHKKNEKNFTIYGSGKPVREWIYIDDAVKTIERAINLNTSIIEPINITNNLTLSVQNIAKIAKNILGFKGVLINDLSFEDGEIIKKMSKQSQRYKKYFSKIKFSNINQSIRKTVEYYLKNS